MVLPLLWYTAVTCHAPDSVVSEIEDIALDFVHAKYCYLLRLRTMVKVLAHQGASTIVLPWLDPIVDLMHQVVSPAGHGLDILFLPIPRQARSTESSALTWSFLVNLSPIST
ncbi:hypothetical protein H310_12617 [Aphanomyces invadans]|uniref:Uncharacterized protein n=1 Tax=Aphanomyces invadans TaxID=157072 RepID=A0A024TJ50_9STRA|nr:hypothetical protein H310_12617 [Aphanomyces invadans]ETV93352.1 hypothetical protein H310_12617 [Aphanomyces invadans]|eukprot:XP_008877988.1 hypothetical protein H310_12617 [Aphanomyces invadans]